MTDHSLPGVITDPVWSSGDDTIATSGIAWLPTEGWGKWSGGLILGNLKDQSVRVLMISPDNKLTRVYNPEPLQGNYGRLRNPVIGPDGALYITTDNGEGDDKILFIEPSE